MTQDCTRIPASCAHAFREIVMQYARLSDVLDVVEQLTKAVEAARKDGGS